LREWERLGDGTKTVRQQPKDKPAHRMSSYLSTAVKIKLKPDGTREFRVRSTFGGDRSDYSGPPTDAGDIETFKLLANAVVSDPHSRMMTLDIKIFILTSCSKFLSMMVKLSDIQLLSLSATACLLADTRGMLLVVVEKLSMD
jgi:hypothetical protein